MIAQNAHPADLDAGRCHAHFSSHQVIVEVWE